MAGIFSRIIAGEIPSYKIAENENYFAFLDINPMAKGHVLVVPKKEIDYVFDLEDSDLTGLMLFSKQIAQAIKQALPCARVGVMVVGMEVPHAHVHLIPISKEKDMNLSNPRLKLEPSEFDEIALKIRTKLS